MLNLFKINRLYLLPPYLTTLFYILPGLLDLAISQNPTAINLISISLISITTYIISYTLFCDHHLTTLYRNIPRINIDWTTFDSIIVFTYFTTVIYAAATAPHIPLLEVFKGASISDLSVYREEFIRTRSGNERALPYIYTILITALMPLVISRMFFHATRKRLAITIIFILSLAITLEKGRAIVALLPLFYININNGNFRKAFKTGIYLLIIITIISFIARGGLSPQDIDQGVMQKTPDSYNIFQNDENQIYYIINRIIYIPYITAIDWLNYLDLVLKNELVYGKSISIVASIFNEETFNLEREVFNFQWGQNETGTGSSNTVFYIDSYLNFGYIGVILYSSLLALLIRIVVLSRNTPLISALTISMYFTTFHSLTAVLFSGGLSFLVLISILFKNTNIPSKNSKTSS